MFAGIVAALAACSSDGDDAASTTPSDPPASTTPPTGTTPPSTTDPPAKDAGHDSGNDASTDAGTDAPAPAKMDVTLAGWPGLDGLTIKSNGTVVKATGGKLSIDTTSTLTFEAAGIELASLAPKSTVTVFDLLPVRDCQSTPELGKLLSLLLTLDSDQDASNGITIPDAIKAPAGTKLSALNENDLVTLENQLVGRSMSITKALYAANDALDQEAWAENTAKRTTFTNDMNVLQRYLDRVLAELALNPAKLTGFAYLTDDQALSIPATLKSQGIAFDGETPVFSWRYGLQRTDSTYVPTLNRPLAFPAEIQAEYGASADGPHIGHIGDIDIADGKLYAPIEDEDDSSQQSYIAIYDAKTLQYTGEKHALPRAEHADGVPWVAVDAARKQFYTVTWSTAAASKLNVFDLTTFALIRSVPLQVSFDGKRVQGAKIYKGMLYASSDTKDSVPGTALKRKRLYKVDPVSGHVIELLTYDEPNRTEAEGIAFAPDGTMNLMVIAPYTTPLYAETTTGKPFDESYSIDGDDWNPSATLRHFSRNAITLREKICGM
ncbi:hypothetical protein AKJ09_04921 [Labilithrix luteola]|uniref:Uncharacterized protein n=1 Tax=Labilithrix luteola TaxID=1391654 RepID=A0A0K1PXM6_9BACT|nr:hypothetical protein AKJ09_04921 [Labilithrix luteola]